MYILCKFLTTIFSENQVSADDYRNNCLRVWSNSRRLTISSLVLLFVKSILDGLSTPLFIHAFRYFSAGKLITS